MEIFKVMSDARKQKVRRCVGRDSSNFCNNTAATLLQATSLNRSHRFYQTNESIKDCTLIQRLQVFIESLRIDTMHIATMHIVNFSSKRAPILCKHICIC